MPDAIPLRPISDYGRRLNARHPYVPSADPLAQIGVFDRSHEATRCPDHMGWHRREFYKVSLIGAGGGRFGFAGQEKRVGERTLVVSPPRAALSWTLDGPQTGYYALFSAAFHDVGLLGGHRLAQSRVGRLAGSASAPLGREMYTALSDLFERLGDARSRPAEARHYLRLALAQITRALPLPTAAPARTAAERLVAAFEDAVAEAASSPERTPLCSVAHYAEGLYVSSSHLSACCRAVTGRSAKALVQHRVTEEAMLRLAGTDAPVGRVALDLGFHDAAHFSHWFKRRAGRSPSSYRESLGLHD